MLSTPIGRRVTQLVVLHSSTIIVTVFFIFVLEVGSIITAYEMQGNDYSKLDHADVSIVLWEQ